MSSESPRSQRALGHAAPAVRDRLNTVPDLDATLAQLVATAHAAHPGLAVDDDDLLRHVVERLDPDRDDAGLAQLAVGDLCVAHAAARGDADAIAWIDGHVLADTRVALAAMDLATPAIDELIQRVRHTLFVADPGTAPKLAGYAGRSSLRRWVRSVAVRMALNARRGPAQAIVSLEDAFGDELARASAHPAYEHMKQLYRDELARALSDALRSLSARERTALRLHHLDGVTLDQLAARSGVHRATVARWLAKSRELLVSRTLAGVEDRLGVDRADAESLLRLVMSRLELTLDADD